MSRGELKEGHVLVKELHSFMARWCNTVNVMNSCTLSDSTRKSLFSRQRVVS